MKKVYKIEVEREGKRNYIEEGTLEELIETFQYTLLVGASYSHEKGNYKINQSPKNIKSLVSNLNKAAHNRGRCYQSTWYSLA